MSDEAVVNTQNVCIRSVVEEVLSALCLKIVIRKVIGNWNHTRILVQFVMHQKE